jgi:redox-sensitive bicupin YhaK (pirin superfamily)
MSTRTLQQVIESVVTSDGAGVRLQRSLGRSQALRLDPFLMLDEFSSKDPDDYVAGFPGRMVAEHYQITRLPLFG